MGSSPARRYVRWALLVGTALGAVFAVHAVVGGGGGWVNGLFTRVIYNAVLVLAAVVVVVRGIAVRRERSAWLLLGGALVLWTAADIYFSLFVQDLDPIPIPSLADGLWLAFYPPAYAAVVLLVRSRLSGLRRGMWLDGVIAAFAVAALCAAVVIELVLDSGLGDSVWQAATTLAYPLADLILLSVTAVVLALNGWRLEPTWRLLGAAFLIFAAADAVYFWETSRGVYEAGGLVDVGWLLMALLCAAAALEPSPERRESNNDGQRGLIVPSAFGLVALGLLVYGNLASINLPALVLATLCTLCVIARMGLTLAQSRLESLTDTLTGLPNRRRLDRDLRERASQACPERPLGLVLFDLNGFKGYNDRFGHPAGDALLVRAGHRLQAAVDGHGVAYRMSGDEFCALLTPGGLSLDELVGRCSAALSERGEGFEIDAAHGLVSLPGDEVEVEDALRVADHRMYALKHGARIPAERQATDVLLALLAERHPDAGDHVDGVAELAVATGRRLGLSDDKLEELALAARLHDIGNAAVPDQILAKPGPLDPDEREIVRRHATAGERILRTAPALTAIVRIVRSTHERVDGHGYPDRLIGDQIPVGARVIAVCAAFDAIIGHRPYAARRTPQQAATELRRCAGTQFDPAVVDAFLDEFAARTIQPAGAPLGESPAASPQRHSAVGKQTAHGPATVD